MTTHLLPRQTPDCHSEQVVVIARLAFILLFHDVLVLASLLCLLGLRERLEFELAKFIFEHILLLVRNHELLVDNHLDETRLVGHPVELPRQLVGEILLHSKEKVNQ